MVTHSYFSFLNLLLIIIYYYYFFFGGGWVSNSSSMTVNHLQPGQNCHSIQFKQTVSAKLSYNLSFSFFFFFSFPVRQQIFLFFYYIFQFFRNLPSQHTYILSFNQYKNCLSQVISHCFICSGNSPSQTSRLHI